MCNLHIKPCPFCGENPMVGPADPEIEGDGWGEVKCVNTDCEASPSVEVYDLPENIEWISDHYKKAAIFSWNKRALNEKE